MPLCLLSPDAGALYPDGPPILFPDGWWCPTASGGNEGEVCVLDLEPPPALDLEPLDALNAPVG